MPKRSTNGTVPKASGTSSLPAPVRRPAPLWRDCPVHPGTQYRRGGWCEACYEQETLDRIRGVDGAFARQLETAMARMQDILQTEIDPANLDQAKVFLGPLVRVIELVTGRFKRPERAEVRGKVAHVHLVNPPVDFRTASKASERAEGTP